MITCRVKLLTAMFLSPAGRVEKSGDVIPSCLWNCKCHYLTYFLNSILVFKNRCIMWSQIPSLYKCLYIHTVFYTVTLLYTKWAGRWTALIRRQGQTLNGRTVNHSTGCAVQGMGTNPSKWTVAPLTFSLVSLTLYPPLPSQFQSTVQYIHTVCGWEGVRGFEYCWVPYFVGVLHSISGQIQNLQNR
jgi:hypothetical protein